MSDFEFKEWKHKPTVEENEPQKLKPYGGDDEAAYILWGLIIAWGSLAGLLIFGT